VSDGPQKFPHQQKCVIPRNHALKQTPGGHTPWLLYGIFHGSNVSTALRHEPCASWHIVCRLQSILEWAYPLPSTRLLMTFPSWPSPAVTNVFIILCLNYLQETYSRQPLFLTNLINSSQLAISFMSWTQFNISYSYLLSSCLH